MTTEEKDLLLKDLCARLPYGVKIRVRSNDIRTVRMVDMVEGIVHFVESDSISLFGVHIEHPLTFRQVIKPYLRPMSSMTEEEMDKLADFHIWNDGEKIFPDCNCKLSDIVSAMNWLNKKMFDYRGLIEKGLALEAPEGMYN